MNYKIEGLRKVGVELVVTAGAEFDPRDFGTPREWKSDKTKRVLDLLRNGAVMLRAISGWVPAKKKKKRPRVDSEDLDEPVGLNDEETVVDSDSSESGSVVDIYLETLDWLVFCRVRDFMFCESLSLQLLQPGSDCSHCKSFVHLSLLNFL